MRIDVSDPDAVAVRSTTLLAGGSSPYDAGFNGDHAYILGNDFGIQVADATTLEPQRLVEPNIAQIPEARAYEEMLVDGDRTYLSSWGTGVVILDASNPAEPVQVGMIPGAFATSLAVRDDVLFVGTTTNGGIVAAFDVSDPAAPVFLSDVFTSKAMRLRAAGNLVFVADHMLDGQIVPGLRILDATDPAAMSEVGLYSDACGAASDVAVTDDLATAYVACEDGLHIVDVSDPTAPVRIGHAQVENPWAPYNALAVRGNRAWYGSDSGITEIDISDATAPVVLRHLPLPAAPRSLRFAPDGRLFAPTGYSGLFVFDETPVVLPPEVFADGFE